LLMHTMYFFIQFIFNKYYFTNAIYLLLFLGIFKWFIELYTEILYTHYIPTGKSSVYVRFTFQEQCRVTRLYLLEYYI
jgi:hypothetical protein